LDFAPPTGQTETVTYKVTASKKEVDSSTFGGNTTITFAGDVVQYNSDIFTFDVSGGYAVNTMIVNTFTGSGTITYEITNVTDNTVHKTGSFTGTSTNLLQGVPIVFSDDKLFNLRLSTVSSTAITYNIQGTRDIDYTTAGTTLAFDGTTNDITISNSITTGDTDAVLFTISSDHMVPSIILQTFDPAGTSDVVSFNLTSTNGYSSTNNSFSVSGLNAPIENQENLLEGDYTLTMSVPGGQSTIVTYGLYVLQEAIQQPTYDVNNEFTTSGSVKQYYDDRIVFNVSGGYSLNTMNVSAISAATTVSYVLYDATGTTQLHSGSFSAIDTNILQGYPLIPSVDTGYVLMLSTTSASAITYSLAATQTDDYAATGETLVFANDALQIQNTIIDGDIDKVSFTVADAKVLT
jgi:hypothetical protein